MENVTFRGLNSFGTLFEYPLTRPFVYCEKWKACINFVGGWLLTNHNWYQYQLIVKNNWYQLHRISFVWSPLFNNIHHSHHSFSIYGPTTKVVPIKNPRISWSPCGTQFYLNFLTATFDPPISFWSSPYSGN